MENAAQAPTPAAGSPDSLGLTDAEVRAVHTMSERSDRNRERPDEADKPTPPAKAPADKPTIPEIVEACRAVAAAARAADTAGIVRATTRACAVLLAGIRHGVDGGDAGEGLPGDVADSLVGGIKASREEYARHVTRANEVSGLRAADRRRLADAGVPGLGPPAPLAPGVASAAADLIVQLLVWLRDSR